MRKKIWCSIVVWAIGLSAAVQAQMTDWPLYTGDFFATRFSPLTEITKSNVSQMRHICAYNTDESAAFETGPIEVEGVIYFTTNNTTFAIDASNCALKWRQSRPGPRGGLGVNRGLAYANGRLFRGTGDGRLLALDAASGQPVW